ncbi:MAG: ABC transporter ATP-binding protein/permease [Anaerolineae bacterium]|nr:ABC transporter ATP-binding protein/permease [Anaerolineae bacterium]MDW8170864.1 ABC transporter ATP-binding protein [Anaerolineae bacterium]
MQASQPLTTSQQIKQTSAASERPRAPLGRAISFLGLHKRAIAVAYGALFVATLAQLAVPELVQNMINAVTRAFRADQLLSIQPTFARDLALHAAGETVDGLQTTLNLAPSLLVNAALLIVGFAIMRGLFAFVQTYMAEWTSQAIAFDMRNMIFAKISRLSFSYYDRNQTGQLMIRATDDVEKVRLFIAQGLVLAVQALLLLVATLVILFATNWRLALVVVPILPLSMILFGVFGKISQPLFAEVQRRISTLNTILQENVAGIKVVKAFVRQQHEKQRFDVATDQLYEQQMRVSRTFATLFPIIFTLAQVGQAAILYFAAPQILGGTLDLGSYQKFNLYLVYIFLPLGQLGFIISLMAQASASSERIFEILDAESEVKNKAEAAIMPPIQGQVEFRDVTFRYFNSSAPVLKRVSFCVQPGQTVALLGATGSGKTTIINLLPRFYDVSDGAILIDGCDVRDVTLDSLRSQIGIVLQETNLFSGTIRDNIAFGRPDASDDEVIEAAKAAAAHDFIMSFPDGYQTRVGERGSTLSGGQKQRIAIARALLLKPRILIMDDSTSSVDFATERQIQRALDSLMKGRTSFVIAQRISTVRNADLIVVLDKGEVAAIGTHAQLMETSPIYAEIFKSQLVEDAQPAS